MVTVGHHCAYLSCMARVWLQPSDDSEWCVASLNHVDTAVTVPLFEQIHLITVYLYWS